MRKSIIAAAAAAIALAPLAVVAAPSASADPPCHGQDDKSLQCTNCAVATGGGVLFLQQCLEMNVGSSPNPLPSPPRATPGSPCSQYTGPLYKSCCDDRILAGMSPCGSPSDWKARTPLQVRPSVWIITTGQG